MMGRGFYAYLDKYKIAEADRAAMDFFKNVLARGLDPKRKATKEEQLNAHILGARCERAALVFFPGMTWHRHFTDFIGKPDLGSFIDVKGVGEDRRRLLSPNHNIKRDFAYLLVSAENHPYYWMAGWLWGSELIKAGEERGRQEFSKRPCFVAEHKELEPLRLLQQVAREKGEIGGEGGI
jgi:hypothetical protein